jgi:hypothetical protein
MLKNSLQKPISIAPLVSFRIIFGLVACYGGLRFLINDWVCPLYQEPSFFFTYLGFDFIHPLQGDWMYLPFYLMIAGGLFIALGLYYRIATIIYFLSFTYVELIDKTNYLNHYYLFSIIALLIIFMPAHRKFSLDCKWRKLEVLHQTPSWPVHLLKFQLACVYVFAGLAKLNPDWLFEAEPLFTWLQSHRDMPLVGNIFASKTTAYIFSWAGCLYDLSIPFLLLWGRTRKLAFVAVILFHLLTALLFPIGLFPFVMIGLTTIFFSPQFHDTVLHFQALNKAKKKVEHLPKWSFGLILIFAFIQVLIPLRFLAYPGNVFWSEEGFRFSWRVMLMHKEGHATFYIKDAETGGEIEVNNADFLNKRQEEQMSTQADMILQYAHYLRARFTDSILHINGQEIIIHDPSVRANVFVSLNGRMATKMVDKSTDLTKEELNLRHRNWVIPLEK